MAYQDSDVTVEGFIAKFEALRTAQAKHHALTIALHAEIVEGRQLTANALSALETLLEKVETMASRMALIVSGVSALAAAAGKLNDSTAGYISLKSDDDSALPSIADALKQAMDAVSSAQTAIDAATKQHNDAAAALDASGSNGGGGGAQPLPGSGSNAGAPGTGAVAGVTPISVAVQAPSPAGSIAVPVSVDLTGQVGATVSGPGIPTGTTVRAETNPQVLVLTNATTAPHDGTETLTVTPAAPDPGAGTGTGAGAPAAG